MLDRYEVATNYSSMPKRVLHAIPNSQTFKTFSSGEPSAPSFERRIPLLYRLFLSPCFFIGHNLSFFQDFYTLWYV